jgi:hypothetical protein
LGIELVSPSSRAGREARAYYLKFDLTKGSIPEIAGLMEVYKEMGAIRACMICKSQGAWERLPEPPATHIEDQNWRVIKIPSIDGTELWIVPESRQSEVELKMGFDKPSSPLLTLAGAQLLTLTYRDPLFRNEVKFNWKNDVICTSLTGATILSPTSYWTLEQLETLKDLGCFAFED